MSSSVAEAVTKERLRITNTLFYSLHIIEGFRVILEVTLVSFSVLNLR